jgi:hypothetical protein
VLLNSLSFSGTTQLHCFYANLDYFHFDLWSSHFNLCLWVYRFRRAWWRLIMVGQLERVRAQIVLCLVFPRSLVK